MADVQFTDAAADDLRALAANDRQIALASLRLAKALESDPYLGEQLREKSNLRPLAQAECLKIKFDREDRPPHARPRYRYRLVYRLEPHYGSPEHVLIMAVGVKPGVYRDATREAAVRLRQLAAARRGLRRR